MKKLIQANTGSGRRRVSQVFADFCEISAITLRNAVDRSDQQAHQAREERYLELIGGYTPDETHRFAELLSLVTVELERRPADILGDLYMTLGLGNARTGQFFTPFSVSTLLAQMTVGDAIAQLDERPFITLSEPAVGSGGMVIAVADALRDQSINYQRQLHVTAQDIDITAVHMAYVQLSLLYIPAVVIHGDTLKVEQLDTWPTPAHVIEGWAQRLTSHTSDDTSTAKPDVDIDDREEGAA